MDDLMDIPVMSMRDVVIAASRSCPGKVPCLICESEPFCRALKEAYRQVQAAADKNETLRKFIEHSCGEVDHG